MTTRELVRAVVKQRTCAHPQERQYAWKRPQGGYAVGCHACGWSVALTETGERVR